MKKLIFYCVKLKVCIELISVCCVIFNVNNLIMVIRINFYNNVEVELIEKDLFVSVKMGKEL